MKSEWIVKNPFFSFQVWRRLRKAVKKWNRDHAILDVWPSGMTLRQRYHSDYVWQAIVKYIRLGQQVELRELDEAGDHIWGFLTEDMKYLRNMLIHVGLGKQLSKQLKIQSKIKE